HRHFGPATSRTRTQNATPATGNQDNPRCPGRRHPPPARPRCQRGAPCRTNDVDTDQRRRTLEIAWAAPLTSTLHRREPEPGDRRSDVTAASTGWIEVRHPPRR